MAKDLKFENSIQLLADFGFGIYEKYRLTNQLIKFYLIASLFASVLMFKNSGFRAIYEEELTGDFLGDLAWKTSIGNMPTSNNICDVSPIKYEFHKKH